MNIGSIFVALGFKVNASSLNGFNASIKTLRVNLAATTVAFTGATYAMKKFIDGGVAAASNLVNFNRQTGLSIEKLNQFAQAGQSLSTGLNVDNITNDIMNLEKTLARIRLGQASVKPFQMLGIDVYGKDAFQVIEQLRTSIKGLNAPTASILLEDLGLNPQFLEILKLSNEEFAKLSKNNFLNSSQAKTINQLGLNVRNLGVSFTNLKNQALAKLAPYFNDLINKTLKWISANGTKIAKTIGDIAKGFGIFVTGIGRAVSFASDFITKITGVENGLKILAVGFAALTLSFSPFLLGLTAILLLLDDIAVWKMGGNSLFGDFYDSIAKVYDKISGIPNIDKILGLGGAIAGVALLTGNVTKLISSVVLLGRKLAIPVALFLFFQEMAKSVASFFEDTFTPIIERIITILGGAAAGFTLGGAPGAVLGALGTAAYEVIGGKEGIQKAYESAKEFIGGDNKIQRGFESVKEFFMPTTNNSSINNANVSNNINLTVNAPSGDALTITESVENALKDLLKTASTSLPYEI